MVYTLRFFSSKCSLFHNSNVFGSCFIHILYTGCAKIEKNNSGAKKLISYVIVYRFLLFLVSYNGFLFIIINCYRPLSTIVDYSRLMSLITN